jgi:hypothetical protein
VKVAPQPAPLLLAGRQDGQARPAQVRGETDPAHGQSQRRSQLFEGRLVPGPQRGRVRPPDQQPADHLVVVPQGDLPPVAGVGP